MTNRPMLLCLLAALASPAMAEPPAKTEVKGALTGRWLATADLFGTPIYERLDLDQHGDVLSGKFGGDKLTGAVTGDKIHFVSTDDTGGKAAADAVLKDGALAGTIVETDDGNTVQHRYTFAATPYPARPTGPAQRHEFTPTVFYRQFSALNKPVLTVAPGDTIHTTTVDAGGGDEKGVSRVLGGNPQTGPFYIQSAMPGDTLVIHLVRLKLNRDYALSDDAIVPRGLTGDMAVKMKDTGKEVRWHLDLAKGLASVEKPGEHLAHYTVPVRPMLGCIATAPSPSRGAPPTQDSGSWGGNMDFNEIVEGATVYLPVSVPGALLYLGDAHALQGDGEINGNALETSMDVEFTVDVIAGHRVPSPRVESATTLMAMGLDGSLDDAFKAATANMAGWLTDEHHLTPSEVAEVLGSVAQYKVSEAADRNAGVVLKIDKARLESLLSIPAK